MESPPNLTMTLPSKRWHWRWYWVPYEAEWLLIPSIKVSVWPRRHPTQPSQYGLGIQWGKWYVGLGVHVYL